MTQEIDCRGLSCPQPVVKTKKALEESSETLINVIVNSSNAVENVRRFALSQGCAVEVKKKDSSYILEISREGQAQTGNTKQDSYVVMITSDKLGEGDEKLGSILMKSFLNTIWEADPKPEKVLFLNSAVKLTCKGSNVLDTLKLLEEAGSVIVSCGTCLAYYELAEELSIGHAGNMYEVVESLLNTGRIIKI